MENPKAYVNDVIRPFVYDLDKHQIPHIFGCILSDEMDPNTNEPTKRGAGSACVNNFPEFAGLVMTIIRDGAKKLASPAERVLFVRDLAGVSIEILESVRDEDHLAIVKEAAEITDNLKKFRAELENYLSEALISESDTARAEASE